MTHRSFATLAVALSWPHLFGPAPTAEHARRRARDDCRKRQSAVGRYAEGRRPHRPARGAQRHLVSGGRTRRRSGNRRVGGSGRPLENPGQSFAPPSGPSFAQHSQCARETADRLRLRVRARGQGQHRDRAGATRDASFTASAPGRTTTQDRQCRSHPGAHRRRLAAQWRDRRRAGAPSCRPSACFSSRGGSLSIRRAAAVWSRHDGY